ncbi:MAG: GtrA family protein [Mucilaginibacter sp.]|uniref:GtrA family protein n=1 Tax=Mucilaginibacter sp. TaxID=1882438 RepID=UPI0034E4268D
MKKLHHFVRRRIFSFIDLFFKPFKQLIPLQTFRYAACGGFNTALDICLFTISYNFIFKKHNFHLGSVTLSPHIASLMLAFSISFTTGFYLNRYVVFQQSGLTRRGQLARFITVNLICILLNYVLLKIFVEHFGLYPTPSKILCTIIIVFFSYFSQTYFFFREKKEAIL